MIGSILKGRIGRRFFWLGLSGALAAAMAVVVVSGALARGVGSPASLAARDPGARVDGNTIVATGKNETVFGVPHRPNFIVGLGSGETIRGGTTADQIGALGANVTVRAGRGADLVYGGPGGTVIGGPGPDLLIESFADATVRITGRQTAVVAAGHDDHILCLRGSGHDVVYAGRSVTIDSGCRKLGDRVLSVSAFRAGRFASDASDASDVITGSGTNSDPFVAPCINPAAVNCTTYAFPRRYLERFWSNEFIPAYQCPADHPYLYRQHYVPGTVNAPQGVDIDQVPRASIWPIGIAMTALVTRVSPAPPSGRNMLLTGIMTGFGNSTATNWSLGKAGYQIILHCTSDPNQATGYGA